MVRVGGAIALILLSIFVFPSSNGALAFGFVIILSLLPLGVATFLDRRKWVKLAKAGYEYSRISRLQKLFDAAEGECLLAAWKRYKRDKQGKLSD